MLKAPFRLPDGWLAAFGYPGSRRFVALYWEPCGDESCFDDGVHSACGLCDNWLYLSFKSQPHVLKWLDEHDIHLGDSERPARHWIVADATTGEVFVAERRAAFAVVHEQRFPGTPG
ncbi:hypothetical protein [Limnoglobus roseus]|uniref:Uncharacterized protein n=1 Tax=Limnoglobus roseus TaxID=2598579 RepID=A0A5C1AGT7_9BACT|nr:hypothetical protein [Limnoglobus roseus]QEL17855.1 hypothetical protein PX52LOC_04866 [Limnoglobus roseus]